MANAGPSSLGELETLSPDQVVLIREHLEKLVASHAFAGSKRTQDFLRLIVRHALEGDIDNLRERMIGAAMFGRPVSYDTGSDSVVRVRASEARKKLALYYSENREENPAVRIDLPSGSYVPRFLFGLSSTPATRLADPPTLPPPSQTSLPLDKHPVANFDAGADSETRAPDKRQIRRPRVLTGLLLGVLLIAVVGYLGFKRWLSDSNTHSGIHSIAILPLENLSGDPAQDYFADGMTEELINELGQVSTLRVISLTSSMSYKGTKKRLPDIARELSVDGVVEGGVLRDGNQVRISAQLIDARTDRPIWAHTYVRDLTSVLAWQGEVAQAIAEEISTEVTPREQALLARKSPVDPEAQDLYLRGVLLRDADECENAIGYFNRSIEKAPGYASAHSALASCYGRLGESGRMPYGDAFSHQKTEAETAIKLDDSLSEAHAELANTAMTLDWDWPRAEAEFRRALELNPNSATSHEKYAFYLVRTGHLQQAISEIERSVDLDPVSESTFHAEGFIYYFAHDYDHALEVARTVRGLKINLPDQSFLTGDIYAEKDNFSEAITQFLKSGSGPFALGHLGNAYARAHQTALAQKTISTLTEDVRKDGVGRYEIALVYVGLGRKQEAFKWLEDAYSAHDVGLVYLKVDPCLDPLRSDPKFIDLTRRVGLAQ